jgi:hypothetical protein
VLITLTRFCERKSAGILDPFKYSIGKLKNPAWPAKYNSSSRLNLSCFFQQFVVGEQGKSLASEVRVEVVQLETHSKRKELDTFLIEMEAAKFFSFAVSFQLAYAMTQCWCLSLVWVMMAPSPLGFRLSPRLASVMR